MARIASKILSASELKVQKADLKVEINAHLLAVKTAEKAIAAAQKQLTVANKAAESALTLAQKQHIAALKAASKEFDAAQKLHGKVIETATKLGLKAEGRAAALVPAVKKEAATA